MSTSNTESKDPDVLKTLWSRINDICCPPPLPGEDAKALFLMEMPGFSADPNAFDPTEFHPGTMMSPECAKASLCDRIPALAPYFFDTGDHISFYWKVFLETYAIKGNTAEKNADLEARYDKAIKMLYGNQEGYINQEKTLLFQGLDKLREKWDDATKKRDQFKKKMQQDKENWPGNYEKGAAPYVEAVEQAYTEYNNLKLQIEKYEASIFAYAMGDLNTVLMEQATSEQLKAMAQLRRDDAGSTGQTFYKVTMHPADWYKWFQPDSSGGGSGDGSGGRGGGGDEDGSGDEDESTNGDTPGGPPSNDDSGWTEVRIDEMNLHQSSHSTFNKFSTGVEASYGGLFRLVNASVGVDLSEGSSSLTKGGSGLSIKFKVRKVLIQRPWMDPTVLHYQTIGIKGLPAGAWSSGKLEENKGSFPLLPTAMVVAKEVEISATAFNSTAKQSFSKLSTQASLKVGIGPFCVGGNFSQAHGSKNSSSTYDSDSKALKINGTQIIGWVCALNPNFPPVDSVNIES